MKPNIINKKSNFVVITYWWGRGNYNKNTQRPCPDEEGKITKKPITYDQMIKRWISSCKKHNCNYMAIEYPKFAKKGGYQDAINYKPTFIKKALEVCNPRGVLYIDGDMLIQKYPHIFDLTNVDYMAQGWNVDPRITDIFCYDPYVFETSGGTMFFGNTHYARKLLILWANAIKKYPGKADDRIISQVFNNSKSLLSSTIVQLPIEYLWFSMDYPLELRKTQWDKRKIYISHPECLTGEDIASTLGANPDRIPPKYDTQITDRVSCRLKKQLLYEYVYFPSKTCVNSMNKYLQVHSKNGIKVIPWDKKYGKYNKIAIKNKNIENTIELKYTSGTVYLVHNLLKNVKKQHVINRNQLLPHIIKYLKNNVNVIYVPNKSTKTMWERVKEKSTKEKIDFICKNKNLKETRYKKEFTLKINKNYPIYFGCNNNILLHLLQMSKNLTMVESHFNTIYTFISRIRCIWI